VIRALLVALSGCWWRHTRVLTENGQEIYWTCAVCGLRSPGIPHDTTRLQFTRPTKQNALPFERRRA
jgi:hypothetical protein